MATWTSPTKSTASYGNQEKNTVTYTNQGVSTAGSLWSSGVFPWLLELPWQYIGAIDWDEPIKN